MNGEALARTIVGIVGNVISGLLFLSPAPTFVRIWKKKTTEEFHPYPYLSTVMNCLFWIFYGLPIVHPDSTLVITINGAGLALELIYLIIFFIFTTKKYRGIIVLLLFAEAALLGVTATISILCFHTHNDRSMFVGIICCLFGIVMYASPFSIIKQVYCTKSTEYMTPWLFLANFLNGVVWFTYANLKTFDPYLAIGNGIGGVFGFAQLLVFGYYTWVYPKFHSSEQKGDVEIQKTNSNRPKV